VRAHASEPGAPAGGGPQGPSEGSKTLGAGQRRQQCAITLGQGGYCVFLLFLLICTRFESGICLFLTVKASKCELGEPKTFKFSREAGSFRMTDQGEPRNEIYTKKARPALGLILRSYFRLNFIAIFKIWYFSGFS
jgi:hypothetical protein